LLALGTASTSVAQSPVQDKLALVEADDVTVETKLATESIEAPVNDETVSANTPPVAAETITRPIRSGQRRHKRDGDLIILAQVSEGAEVMADGNIHIYGTLRGRALAGVHGDTSARIYCQNLQAELVAIAGHYRVSEDIDDAFKNHPVQIYLSGQYLIIEKL
jgi:septum site-determining protein MinC